MAPDRAENEPEEYDPEAEFRDPDSDSITIPRVPTEDAGSTLRADLAAEFGNGTPEIPDSLPEPSEVPADLRRTFWVIVLVVNAAVLAVSLGLILSLFNGLSTHGIALVVGGVVLFALAVRRYHNYQAANDTSEQIPDESERS
ncbi:DUF805 domain-containing protein [Natrarchaeobius halalkaliphilus]|uniref:DUF805 domain-containing protein n=1 Tax=Natrarchaeobius halalkaliphilus TaxID=1679091 RepID=UPI001FB42CA4|nr:DUF805 domain-containing protein [Natrarchaeobius halalkaliphilus]